MSSAPAIRANRSTLVLVSLNLVKKLQKVRCNIRASHAD